MTKFTKEQLAYLEAHVTMHPTGGILHIQGNVKGSVGGQCQGQR